MVRGVEWHAGGVSDPRTDPRGDRYPHIPAASAATYPLRCFAPQWARFDNRQKRPAHQPLPSLLSAAAAQEVQAVPRTDNDTRRTNSARSAPPILHDPQRAKGSLNRRFEWFSLVTFFLQKRKLLVPEHETPHPAPAGSVPPIPRRRQPPPTHCGAPRRNGRDLIIATRPAYQPLPSLLSAAAAQEVQAIPRTDNVPRRTNSAKLAPPNLHLPAPRQGVLRP